MDCDKNLLIGLLFTWFNCNMDNVSDHRINNTETKAAESFFIIRKIKVLYNNVILLKVLHSMDDFSFLSS